MTGMAPFCVQTKADTLTAVWCASRMDLPRRICATNEPVKESPAPTVSATVTLGVGTKLSSVSVKTYEPTAPQVRMSICRSYFTMRSRQTARVLSGSSAMRCPGSEDTPSSIVATTSSSSSLILSTFALSRDSAITSAVYQCYRRLISNTRRADLGAASMKA